MSTLGKRIREQRALKEISQSELGKVIGVGKTTISNYETGYSSPDPESLTKISEILNVSTDYLLGITDINNQFDKTHKSNVDPDIELIQRARSKMDYKQKKKMMDLLRLSFDDAFEEEDKD